MPAWGTQWVNDRGWLVNSTCLRIKQTVCEAGVCSAPLNTACELQWERKDLTTVSRFVSAVSPASVKGVPGDRRASVPRSSATVIAPFCIGFLLQQLWFFSSTLKCTMFPIGNSSTCSSPTNPLLCFLPQSGVTECVRCVLVYAAPCGPFPLYCKLYWRPGMAKNTIKVDLKVAW